MEQSLATLTDQLLEKLPWIVIMTFATVLFLNKLAPDWVKPVGRFFRRQISTPKESAEAAKLLGEVRAIDVNSLAAATKVIADLMQARLADDKSCRFCFADQRETIKEMQSEIDALKDAEEACRKLVEAGQTEIKRLSERVIVLEKV